MGEILPCLFLIMSFHQKKPYKLNKSLVLIIIFIGVFLYILLAGYDYLASLGMEYEWQWNRAWRYFGKWTKEGFDPGPLFKGIVLSIGIACIGWIFSLLTGLVISLMRLSPYKTWKAFSIVFVGVLRNTPLLLQLFFMYFLVAPIFGFTPFWTAIVALSAFEGSYFAEIFRAAILSISRTQWEASFSLGFNLRQTLGYIIFPQAFRNALPSITGQSVSLLKDTTLVSAIAVADLTLNAQAIIAETFMAFEIWLLVSLIYLILALCFSLPGLILEKWYHRHY